MAASFPPVEDPASIGPLYILHFATSNHAFRLPDFLAAAEYLRIPFAFVPTPAKAVLEECRRAHDASEEASSSGFRPDLRRPFALAHLPMTRQPSTCCAVVCRYDRSGRIGLTVAATMNSMPAISRTTAVPCGHPTWRRPTALLEGTHLLVQLHDQRQAQDRHIQCFSYMDLKGRIQLKNPSMRWGVMEEFVAQELWPNHLRDEQNNFPGTGKDGEKAEGREELGDKDPRLVQIFLGRRIDVKAAPLYSEKATAPAPRKSSDPTQEGQTGLARDLIEKLNLKKRVYIGNTSMEAEMSLLMASMALAGPGKLIYDPFAGTGSMLYASAVFGAMAFGSDIDGRPMRGKENISDSNSQTGIVKSATQYGVRDHILDTVVFDMTQNPWRKDLLFPVNDEESPPASRRPTVSWTVSLQIHLRRPSWSKATRQTRSGEAEDRGLLDARRSRTGSRLLVARAIRLHPSHSTVPFGGPGQRSARLRLQPALRWWTPRVLVAVDDRSGRGRRE